MKRYYIKDKTLSASTFEGGIWDELTKNYVDFKVEHNNILCADVVCRGLNDDFNLYNLLLCEYIRDIPIKCPNCQTENYHFTGKNFCCAFC